MGDKRVTTLSASNPSIGKNENTKIMQKQQNLEPVIVNGDNGSSKLQKKTGGGKNIGVRVQMLDDTITMFHIKAKAMGRVLFDDVCTHLNLIDTDFFGLEYADGSSYYWLDFQKHINRQIDPTNPVILRFCVKFYTPDPAQLEDEFTRYLFTLQIKRDLNEGHLKCSEPTMALMLSYLVQSEFGDWHPEIEYNHNQFVIDNHKKHMGQSPAEADLNLLETARRCDLYGIKMHPCKDNEGVGLNLAVAHLGLVVFQQIMKINTFSWAKIRKLSFKRKRFLIKLHTEGYDLVEFFFETRNQCKNFWKKCVEHHGFFRCAIIKDVPKRHKTRVLSRGSSFRYSGKTQKQMLEYVRDNYVKRQNFQRSASFRQSAHSSVNSMGTSLSAHPLLPIQNSSFFENNGHFNEAESKSSFPSTKAINRPSVAVSPIQITDNISIVSQSKESILMDNCSHASQPIDLNRNVEDDKDSFIAERPVEVNVINTTYYASQNPESPSIIRHNPDKIITNNINGTPNGSVGDDIKKPNRIILSKMPPDIPYFIAKEILATEKTYKKDLDVINVYWRNEVANNELLGGSVDLIELLLSLISPLATIHASFVQDLELCLQTWHAQTHPLGHILLNNIPTLLPLYEEYLDEHTSVLEQFDGVLKRNEKFEQLHIEFESQKVCYLPFTSFILKPLHRLVQYHHLLQRLLDHYSSDHFDRTSCQATLTALQSIISPATETLRNSENIATLHELQHDIINFNILSPPNRNFIRHGCLLKHSRRKGYQQRMFFLFSDILLYTSRGNTAGGQHFRVHGHMPLRGVMLELDTEASDKFTIYGGSRALIVAAQSQTEKEGWVADLQEAIQKAKDHTDSNLTYLSLKSCCSSDELIDKHAEADAPSSSTSQPQSYPQRTNTTVQVCWHRNTTISIDDQISVVQNQLSGYLLRKFKNSNGWQKLWVVFTSFCLFFYKSSSDDFPLASLPLLGYVVAATTQADNIGKDFVFKLQYKNHIYFFRAESEYTFQRWLQVIASVTYRSN